MNSIKDCKKNVYLIIIVKKKIWYFIETFDIANLRSVKPSCINRFTFQILYWILIKSEYLRICICT